MFHRFVLISLFISVSWLLCFCLISFLCLCTFCWFLCFLKVPFLGVFGGLKKRPFVMFFVALGAFVVAICLVYVLLCSKVNLQATRHPMFVEVFMKRNQMLFVFVDIELLYRVSRHFGFDEDFAATSICGWLLICKCKVW